MKQILIIICVTISLCAFASDYNTTYTELTQQIEEQLLRLRENTASRVELRPVFDSELFSTKKVIRVRLCEKPLEDYYWEVIIELSEINSKNIITKVDDLIKIATNEYRLQKERQAKGQKILINHIPEINTLAAEVTTNGLYTAGWIQIPLDKTWMRTSLALKSGENGDTAVGIESSIWSLIHTETYYDKSKVGIVKLGTFKGELTNDDNSTLVIKLVEIKEARSNDLNRYISFFYQYGINFGIENIFSLEDYYIGGLANAEARIGFIFKDTLSVSVGSQAATRFNSEYMFFPNIKLSMVHRDIALTITGGYTFNQGFDQNSLQLTDRWNAGLSLRVGLK